MSTEEAIKHLIQYVLETEENDYRSWVAENEIDEDSPIAASHPYRIARTASYWNKVSTQ